MTPPDIKKSLIDIYETNWKTANAVKPLEFKTKSFSEVYPDGITLPCLTAPQATESSIGETGYSAMSNNGPVQQYTGQAQVNLWVTKEAAHDLGTYDGNIISPEAWLERARQELGRITREKVIELPGYDYIAWDSGQDRHEKDRQPVMFRRMSFVKYSYKKR